MIDFSTISNSSTHCRHYGHFEDIPFSALSQADKDELAILHTLRDMRYALDWLEAHEHTRVWILPEDVTLGIPKTYLERRAFEARMEEEVRSDTSKRMQYAVTVIMNLTERTDKGDRWRAHLAKKHQKGRHSMS
jgi:hypothetical protein